MSDRGNGTDGRAVALPLPEQVARDDARRVTLFGLANAFIRNRYLFVLPLVGGALAVAVSLSTPREYGASASFVPASAGEGSQYAGLAQQFGMRLGSSDVGQSPDFYGALLTTRGILRDVVETEYAFQTAEGEKRGTLVQLLELDRPGAKLPAGRTPVQAAMEELQRTMGVSVNWDTGIVRVSARARWPELSELIVARVVELTQDFDISKRQTQASARRRFAEDRYNEGKTALQAAEARLERFVTSNRLFSQSPLLVLEYTNLQQEMLLRQQVYAALVQNFEQARIEEVRNTPVITVLETPDGAAVPLSRKTLLKGLVGLIFGFAVAVALSLLRDSFRFARGSRTSDYEEFQQLRREVLHDLRRLRPGGRGRDRLAAGS